MKVQIYRKEYVMVLENCAWKNVSMAKPVQIVIL